MKSLKQSIGIDVAKDTLVCCIGGSDQNEQFSFSKTKTFSNDIKGFAQLMQWVTPSKGNDVVFVMEATGVYYENLAYWLDSKGEKLSVLLPNKVKHYAKSLNLKTKTDGVDAQLLSRIGLERKLTLWTIPSKIMREVKFLSRAYREDKAKLVIVKNQLHAKEHAHGCPASVIKRLKKQIAFLQAQLLETEAELRVTVMSDSLLSDKVTKISTIPGISFMTIISILAETNAFALVENAKQLVSYAGLDIQQNQSGAKEGKTRISKKGNSYIRNALYMPALCASKHNPDMKVFYNRIIEKKPAKKIGITAVARKLLILTYILWKNDTEFVGTCKVSRQPIRVAYTG